MNIEPLQKLGLTNGEISVYLSILKQGLVSTGPIIKETGLQSSSVYHILEILIKRGLLSFQTKNKKKYYFAVFPERLLDFVEEQKKNLDIHKQQIEMLLPALNHLRQRTPKPEQEVIIFEGWNGVLSAFKEAYKHLKPGQIIYAYTITKEFGEANAEQVRWLINKVRTLREEINKKQRHKITMRIIAEKGSVIGKDQAKTKHTTVKFIDKKYINPAVVNIYGDVTIIALWLKKPVAFYIVSKEVSESFKNNFDLLWNLNTP